MTGNCCAAVRQPWRSMATLVWDETGVSHLSCLTRMKNEEGDLKFHPRSDC